MINPNELRIGNLVYCNTSDLVVKVQWPHPAQLVVDIKGPFVRCEYTHGDLEEFDPIPLTPEWLGRFGFKKPIRREYYELNGICICHEEDNDFKLIHEEVHEGDIITIGSPFQNLHELQNLYFALTGEELTIKEIV